MREYFEEFLFTKSSCISVLSGGFEPKRKGAIIT